MKYFRSNKEEETIIHLLESKIRSVNDWPKKGVVFRDITPVLEDGEYFGFLVDEMARMVGDKPVDKIVGIDARGFLLASALAYKLGSGLAVVRKKGKLPPPVLNKSYSLEYASDCLEMREGSIGKGERVLIVDDVLATGGTMKATVDIIHEMGGQIVGILFLIELSDLGGRATLKGENIQTLINY